MSFDWSAYRTVAELSKQAADGETDALLKEAHCRSSISRAYYFAFNIALPTFLPFWQSMPRETRRRVNKHQFLIDRFNKYHNQTNGTKQDDYHDVGVKLDRLRGYRNNADYDDVLSEPPDRRARAALKVAQQIARLIDSNP